MWSIFSWQKNKNSSYQFFKILLSVWLPNCWICGWVIWRCKSLCRPRSILFWKVYTFIYAWRIKLLNWNKDSILLARSCNFFREKLEQLHWFGILQDFDLHLQLWYACLKYFFEKLFFFSIVGFKYLFSSLHFASACEFFFFVISKLLVSLFG